MMVTLTHFELNQLSPAERKAHLAREEKLVYGMRDDGSPSFKRDKKGKPMQDGIGSKGRETANHFAALRKREHEGLEPPGAYEAAVAEIWARDPKRAEACGLFRPAKEKKSKIVEIDVTDK